MAELSELGLSSYEEKAYRTLLVTGAVTAAELSATSGVPKGRIYDVLNGLEARKLIWRQSNDPNRYAAVQPETVVDRLLTERAYELKHEWDRYCEKANTVRSNLLPTPPTESSFWLGSLGSDEMSTALQQHMRTAENVVKAAVGPPYEEATWETLQSEVEGFFEGTTADLSVALLFSEKAVTLLPDRFPHLIENQPADITVKTTPEIALSFDIVDNVETTIDIPHPVSGNDRVGVIGIKDSQVVSKFDQYFQRLWNNAVPLLE
ncbi:Sugar-specific transcriptional regulator TrmB [Haloarcula vallismortis]|uniref:Transcriptional regulator, TrmB n=2 Tax=Haloarcula vallismortis TaxID=28442 RepID=M0JC81_HALVA|nr:helix-turn-helix domain-containing protein [Haloarcula vallismortis]EMA05624.1 transcriptional regulator, TrmB [Haloarcula vallismortis ATCC 29715]SDX39335.1 Sugar-specific transcriptional regulator TrmB [Haloarcula vallismortis]